MSGFGVAAARLGAPDTNLLSYNEVLDQARCDPGGACAWLGPPLDPQSACMIRKRETAHRSINEATRAMPIIGDGDTGYGNALSVKRTVRGFANAGCAGILIEDQV